MWKSKRRKTEEYKASLAANSKERKKMNEEVQKREEEAKWQEETCIHCQCIKHVL